MKKVFLALLLFPTLLFAQTKGFTLTGKISGIDTGPVKITSTQDANQVIAEGSISQGAFVLKGTLAEPGLYFLNIAGEQPLYLYLENSDMKVNGTKENLKDLRLEGSKSHIDFVEFQNIFNPLIGNLNQLAAQLQTADAVKKEKTMKSYDSLVKIINQQVDQYIGSKKNSYVSPFVMFVFAQLTQDYGIMDTRYNQLSEEIRNSNIGRSLAEFIAFNRVGTIGSQAIEFTQADTAGNPVSLSSFKGKYVLIDFWASWCRPCRVENPHVVSAFKKFNRKNFTVLGVSLDQDKAAWLKAIEKDNLTWTHISDLKFWENEVAQLYRVQSIPQNFLVDPNGRIIAKDLRGEELEKKLCELLGCK